MRLFMFKIWQHFELKFKTKLSLWINERCGCFIKKMFCLCLFAALISGISCNLWCYSCVSSEPGCEEFYVDWRIHHAITCPLESDKCVKIIEKRGVETFITRDCLSNLKGQRKDIPADTYDGCRKAADEPKLAVYVDNHISELEIKNKHYEETVYCFCEFDEWCNIGKSLYSNKFLIVLGLFFTILQLIRN